MRRAALALALAPGILLACAAPAWAATFVVGIAADEPAVGSPADGVCDSQPGAGVRCSLRAAVQEANGTAGPDIVVLPDLGAEYDLSVLGAGDDAALSGDLDVSSDLTIQGSGQPVIDGVGADRVLHVGPGPGSPAVTVAGAELRGGGGVSRGAGVYVEDGALRLERVTVAGGTASSPGGMAEGGGLWADSGTHSIEASTISQNTADGQTGARGGGAGVGPGAGLTFLNSTVSSNAATSGAGDAFGGGLWSGGSISLTHATMDANGATAALDAEGGNAYALGGSLAFSATIVSAGEGDPGAENCAASGGTLSSLGFNLEASASAGSAQCGVSTAVGDRFASSAGLTPLADRGGPTLTHALFTHSPALDAIPSCFPVATDQRGEARPGGVACEIGSFERQEAVPAGARCFGRKPTIVGKKTVARIIGTPGPDVILGSAGSERIEARGGKDLVCAGKGRDRVRGGASRDRIAGEEGRDRLFGEDGKDELRGDAGRDFLDGGPGRDKLNGGPARDGCRKSSADKLRSC